VLVEEPLWIVPQFVLLIRSTSSILETTESGKLRRTCHNPWGISNEQHTPPMVVHFDIDYNMSIVNLVQPIVVADDNFI